MISHWTVVAMLVVVVLNTLFIAGLAVGLFLINQRMNDALAQAGPLLDKAAATLGRVEEGTVQMQQRVDRILDRTTLLVEQVSERVDTTTAIAEEAVTEPLIGAASLLAGINRGLRTYAEQSTERGDGR